MKRLLDIRWSAKLAPGSIALKWRSSRVPALALALPFLILSASASASPEVDRLYALETVGAIKAWDNVDGLFADYVSAAYKEFFSKQSRFVYQDLSKADDVLKHAKIPYGKVIEDVAILGQIARSTKSQTLLRTRISKQGSEYQAKIEWLHSPKMDVLSSEAFVMNDMAKIQGELQAGLGRLFAKLPFVAMVTGRDESSVTVNAGTSSGVKPGDTLVIGTLDEVKKHPLLKQIVDWRFSPTGKAEVVTVDDAIAFATLKEEEPGRQVARYQKVVAIQPKPIRKEDLLVAETGEERPKEEEPPRIGWGSGGLWIGNLSRQFTGTSSGKSGSGLLFGATAEAQVWLNREFFSELGFTYGFTSYSQKDIGTGGIAGPGSFGPNSVSASFSQFKIDMGYSYLVSGDFFGPKGWLRLGFHSNNYSFPSSTVASGDLINPISFKSFFIGIGGDLPVRNGWGALINLDFGLLNSASEGGTEPSSVDSARDVTFFVGAYYHYTKRITFKGGIEVIANGADLTGGATISQKVVTFAPSIVYFF